MQTSKKDQIILMLTSFTQENRKDYAEQIYEILQAHFADLELQRKISSCTPTFTKQLLRHDIGYGLCNVCNAAWADSSMKCAECEEKQDTIITNEGIIQRHSFGLKNVQGHATYTTPNPPPELVDAVNKMAELAYKNLEKMPPSDPDRDIYNIFREVRDELCLTNNTPDQYSLHEAIRITFCRWLRKFEGLSEDEGSGGTFYQLFKYFSDAHNLILVESELHEIIQAVKPYLPHITSKSGGVQLIDMERKEQIEKHGYDVLDSSNKIYYEHEQLINAALYALTLNEDYYPKSWGDEWHMKMAIKSNTMPFKEWRIERLKIAGALIAAEIDRLNSITKVQASVATKAD